MKTNHLIASAAAIVAVMFIVIIVLFSRQSGLEDEIAVLRTTLETSPPAARAAASSSPAPFASSADIVSSIGTPRPFTSEDPLTEARERLMDLERVVNGQADLIEDLLAESARIAEARRKASMRAWGPEQAVGAPDTMSAGDQRTAWAPAVADGGVEWLQADFENPADLAKIVVRQTCNPGCITKVVAVTDSGAEVPIWTGEDPGKGKALDDTAFAVPGSINAKRVKVYLDTSKVSGWEEIDAMQIVGRDGTAQWAKSVNSSSTYASGGARLGFSSSTTDLLLLTEDFESTGRIFNSFGPLPKK